jgi:hypothetical protein
MPQVKGLKELKLPVGNENNKGPRIQGAKGQGKSTSPAPEILAPFLHL